MSTLCDKRGGVREFWICVSRMCGGIREFVLNYSISRECVCVCVCVCVESICVRMCGIICVRVCANVCVWKYLCAYVCLTYPPSLCHVTYVSWVCHFLALVLVFLSWRSRSAMSCIYCKCCELGATTYNKLIN